MDVLSTTKDPLVLVLTSYEIGGTGVVEEVVGTGNAPAPANALSVSEVSAMYASKVKKLYYDHCPNKLDHVDGLLDAYRGDEQMLYEKLYQKYEGGGLEDKSSRQLEDVHTQIWIRALDKVRTMGTPLPDDHRTWLRESMCIADLKTKRKGDTRAKVSHLSVMASDQAKVNTRSEIDQEYAEEIKILEEEQMRRLRMESQMYRSEKARLEEQTALLQSALTSQVAEMRTIEKEVASRSHTPMNASPIMMMATPVATATLPVMSPSDRPPMLPRLVHDVLQQQSVIATQHVLILKQLEEQQETIQKLQNSLRVSLGQTRRGIESAPDYFESPPTPLAYDQRQMDIGALPTRIASSPLPISMRVPRYIHEGY